MSQKSRVGCVQSAQNGRFDLSVDTDLSAADEIDRSFALNKIAQQ